MFKQIKGHTFLHWEIKAKQILDMFLHNKRNKFNQTWSRYPWVEGIQVCANEELCLAPNGGKSENIFKTLKKNFSRTTGKISTKLGTKLTQITGIQVCPREDNSEIIKNTLKTLKIFFSRAIGLFLTKLSKNYPEKNCTPVQMKMFIR